MRDGNAISGLVPGHLGLRPAGSWVHSATRNSRLGFRDKREREIMLTTSEGCYEVLTKVVAG